MRGKERKERRRKAGREVDENRYSQDDDSIANRIVNRAFLSRAQERIECKKATKGDSVRRRARDELKTTKTRLSRPRSKN